MRIRTLALVGMLALSATGCIPVASLYPLVPPDEGVAVPEIVGEWGDSTATFRFHVSDLESRTRYGMTYQDATDSTTTFTVRFERFGGRLFADLVLDAESMAEGDRSPFLWPMHAIFRVDIAGDSLRMAFLDDDWLEEAIEKHEVKLHHETPAGDLVITEKTAGLQAMVRKLANVDAAFDEHAMYLHRR